MIKTSKVITKTLATVLSLAMVVTSLTVTDANAAAKGKVKSVKLADGKTLVLKKGQSKTVKVTVKTTKKNVSQKVTAVSSNTAVATAKAKGSKVIVKAVGAKGTAKVTIAAKANAKKKVVLKVKIGTPVKKVTLKKAITTTSVYNTSTKKTKVTKKNVAKTAKKKGITLYTVRNQQAAGLQTTMSCQLKASVTPKKATAKSVSWTVKNNSIAYVTPTGIVTPKKAGTTYVFGKAKDGSGKQVKVKIIVKTHAPDPTPTPNYEEPDTRTPVIVEDFESYEVGYNWELGDKGTSGKATKGKPYVDKNVGKMTVVKDPENPDNKCLKIEYNGDTQAYDYAPIFNLKLKEKLGGYTAVQLKSRAISNSSDCKYKSVYGYFAKYGKITPDYYFATTWDSAGATEEDIELHKFDVEKSMIKGKDEDFNVKDGDFAGMKYNHKTFPFYYDNWTVSKEDMNRSLGFKEAEDDLYDAGWHVNTLDYNATNINNADATLLNTKNISFVVGSTYSGNYAGDYYMTLYLDDIAFMEGETPCTGITVTPIDSVVTEGNYITIDVDNDIVFEPAATTQKELVWSSSDETVATVDTTSGSPEVKGLKPGKATITATNKANSAVAGSFEIEVVAANYATEDFNVDLSKTVAVGADIPVYSNIATTFNAGTLSIPFTQANNEHVIIDLGEGGVDLSQYKGIEITAFSSTQLSLEIYPDTMDLTADKWWEKQYYWRTFPFFTGSAKIRAFEGGGYDGLDVETCKYNWVTDGDLRGSLKKARYIMIKANKFDSNNLEPRYDIMSIKFRKDEYTDEEKALLPKEKDLEAAGHVKNS